MYLAVIVSVPILIFYNEVRIVRIFHPVDIDQFKPHIYEKKDAIATSMFLPLRFQLYFVYYDTYVICIGLAISLMDLCSL